MVRDAVLDGTRARVLAGAGRKNSVCQSAELVLETAPSHPDRSGGRVRTLFAAPVVSRRALSADQRQTRSALVHALSHHTVLSLGHPGGNGCDGDGTLSVRAFAERAARHQNPE